MKFIKLSEIFDVHAGGTPSRAKMTEYYGGKIPWVKISDMLQEKISFTEEYITDKAVKDKNLKILPAGTLLISIFATVGRTAILKIDAATNQAIVGLISKNEYFNNLYVKYFVDHKINDIKKLSRGVAQNNINKSILSSIEIPIKTINEQIQIVNKLVIADELRQKRKKAIELLDEYLRSVFYDMFGDPVKNEKGWDTIPFESCIEYIGDIGSNGSNATISKNLEMFDTENYAIMIRTTNLNANNFTDNLKFVSKKTYDFFSKSQIFGGEIIMNKIGSAGDFWIMPYLNKPVSLGLNQLVIRLKNLNTNYLYYYLSTNFGKAKIKASINGAVTKSITKSAVKKLPLVYPDMKLQKQFSEIVEHVKKTKAKMLESLKEMNNLFNSLMQQAFKG